MTTCSSRRVWSREGALFAMAGTVTLLSAAAGECPASLIVRRVGLRSTIQVSR